MIESILGHAYTTADKVIIGIPYEQTASFGKGTKDAPLAIVDILHSQLELFNRYTKTVPVRTGKYGYKIFDEVTNLPPKQMVHFVENLITNEDRPFILLGGEHSVTIGALYALAKRHNPSDVTVVQIDAHLDLRVDDSEYKEINPSRFAHSTVMRHAHQLGYNILPIGIRTIFEDEYKYVKEHNIKYFEWGRYDIPEPSYKEILKSIKTKYIYLTIDVDGFDPAVMPGTGTPVPGGIDWKYGEGLVIELIKHKELIGADIVEVAPQEHTPRTEYNAAQLAYHLLSL